MVVLLVCSVRILAHFCMFCGNDSSWESFISMYTLWFEVM